MKKNIIAVLSIALLINLSSFAQGKFDKWPEIKSFHAVISATFHPSETGDLEPIKKRSAELLKSATALSNSKIPAEFDKKEVQEAVKKLQKEAAAIDKMVAAKAKDEALKTALVGLHDTFHTIVEKCQPGDHHDHDGHGHEGHDHKH
jgi:hypothetical protein